MRMEEKLVSLRKEKNITQAELAEVLDVSRQAISRWEVGSAVPSTENLKRLSELYGVSLDYLLNGEVESPGRQEKRKQPKWLILVAGIIAVIIVGVFIYGMGTSEKTQDFDFNGMESESWDAGEVDGFSMVWYRE